MDVKTGIRILALPCVDLNAVSGLEVSAGSPRSPRPHVPASPAPKDLPAAPVTPLTVGYGVCWGVPV